MRFPLITAALLLMTATIASAQLASHQSTVMGPERLMQSSPAVVSDKAVAKVNGAVLTDRDLLREMYSIFPYAKQHSGFPKGMESDIRQGALQMIIFEELVYQEAQRKKMSVPPEQINRAVRAFRKQQFDNNQEYEQYLQAECKGSEQVLKQKIRRSLLIEALLKAEVNQKSVVTLAAARAFYEKNPQQFKRRESIHIQTISIIPPQSANASVQKEAKQRAQDALKQAKTAKTYREFGLLAEKLSDDDWHVNMGDRKAQDAAALPPPIVDAVRKMKVGEVSDLLQFGTNYTLFRLQAYTPAGKISFQEARKQLLTDLQKTRANQLQTGLNQRLQKNAKVQIL
jgi:hypothetical protein